MKPVASGKYLYNIIIFKACGRGIKLINKT